MLVRPEGPACHTGATSCFYRKLEGDVRIMDYACAENNRNPIDPLTGRTLTLDAEGNPIDAGYREDAAPGD